MIPDFEMTKKEHSPNSKQLKFYVYIGYKIRIKAHVHDTIQWLFQLIFKKLHPLRELYALYILHHAC